MTEMQREIPESIEDDSPDDGASLCVGQWQRPGLFDLRHELGRAPTVEEYRESRR